jgi:GntR family transcriptional regulator
VQLVINPGDELPIYRQIMRQIIEAIAGGRLNSGDKLPSHRDLSEQAVVAPLTVKKAYDELEAAGFLETQRGRGTFIRAALPEPDRAKQLAGVQSAARNLLSQAYVAGLDLAAVVKLVEAADREIKQPGELSPVKDDQ